MLTLRAPAFLPLAGARPSPLGCAKRCLLRIASIRQETGPVGRLRPGIQALQALNVAGAGHCVGFKLRAIRFGVHDYFLPTRAQLASQTRRVKHDRILVKTRCPVGSCCQPFGPGQWQPFFRGETSAEVAVRQLHPLFGFGITGADRVDIVLIEIFRAISKAVEVAAVELKRVRTA